MKNIHIFIVLTVLLSLSIISAGVVYDDPNLPRLNPTVEGNGSFNETLTDLTYLRLDASNDPITDDLTLNENLYLLDDKEIILGEDKFGKIKLEKYNIVYGDIMKFFTNDSYFVFDDNSNEVTLTTYEGNGLTVQGGDGYIGINGGNLYAHGGKEGDGTPAGNTYLCNDGATTIGECWMIDSTGLYMGDSNHNSSKIYHDGDDLVIDSRWTGTGGTLLFPTGAEMEGNLNFNNVDELSLAQAQNLSITNITGDSNLSAGVYCYDFAYGTNEGYSSTIRQTFGSNTYVQCINISEDNEVILQNIPISTDDRVNKLLIFRTEVNQVPYIARPIHTTTDYPNETFTDIGYPPGVGGLNYLYPDSTAGTITIEEEPFIILNGNNIFMGEDTGQYSEGYSNVGIGNKVLDAATSASSSTCVGHGAGTMITTATGNVMIGANSGLYVVTGQNNVMIGTSTYPNSAASDVEFNTFVGTTAGANSVGAGQDSNTYVGYSAGRNFGGTANLILGTNTGYVPSRIASSNYNIIIGISSGRTFGTGANYNIIMGRNIEPDDVTGDYQLNIGNLLNGSVDPSDKWLRIEGNFTVPYNLEVGGCIVYNSSGTPRTLGDCV